MNPVDVERALEQNYKLEKLIESLIAMLGRSNQRLDDLTKRVSQIEQYLVETARPVPPTHDGCFSFHAQTENLVPKA